MKYMNILDQFYINMKFIALLLISIGLFAEERKLIEPLTLEEKNELTKVQEQFNKAKQELEMVMDKIKTQHKINEYKNPIYLTYLTCLSIASYPHEVKTGEFFGNENLLIIFKMSNDSCSYIPNYPISPSYPYLTLPYFKNENLYVK